MCPSTADKEGISSTSMRQRQRRRRRGQRDKQAAPLAAAAPRRKHDIHRDHHHRRRQHHHHHESRGNGGSMAALWPSLLGLAILSCGVMAKLGFRGRASVAGIDLGTTNSVICVQQLTNGVGRIDCVRDPATNSAIVPSVVSFLEPHEQQQQQQRPRRSSWFVGYAAQPASLWLDPPPSHVVVGAAAKRRIDSHPHHTVYNAKRVLGRRPDDPAVAHLAAEVEFAVHSMDSSESTDHDAISAVWFSVPDTPRRISPRQVGAYVVHHLIQLTHAFLGHDNIKAAVICVPAQFNARQRHETAQAFRAAGVAVARIVEEPTAAALAYGLHRKPGVDYILVYDFGGGTLDVSILHVSDGFVDVMGSDGDDRLGGADFDAAVAHVLQAQHAAMLRHTHAATMALQHNLAPTVDLDDQLASSCHALAETPLCTGSSFHTIGEQLKIQLSNDDSRDATSQCLGLVNSAASMDALTLATFCQALQPVPLRISFNVYHDAVTPLYHRAILPVTRLLHNVQIDPADIDEVVMVGGSTRIPHVRALVRQALPTAAINTHIDPDITVAYGAASIMD